MINNTFPTVKQNGSINGFLWKSSDVIKTIKNDRYAINITLRKPRFLQNGNVVPTKNLNCKQLRINSTENLCQREFFFYAFRNKCINKEHAKFTRNPSCLCTRLIVGIRGWKTPNLGKGFEQVTHLYAVELLLYLTAVPFSACRKKKWDTFLNSLKLHNSSPMSGLFCCELWAISFRKS